MQMKWWLTFKNLTHEKQQLRITIFKLYPGEGKHYFARNSYANESVPELLPERSETVIIFKSSLKLELNYFPNM